MTNHASLSNRGTPVALELLRSGVALKKIFAPEHGVYSQAEDGKPQHNGTDKLTQLPVVSLYGDKLSPSADDLKDIDVLLIDLPNIGCRFYTYLWTISYAMEACKLYSKEIVILDWPNQRSTNTAIAEGPLLDEARCSSFLGRWEMPVTHGFSYGQLAKWFSYSRKIDLELSVIGYENNRTHPEFTVPPSPAICSQQAIWLYPFTGLFEGVNVTVGRGTSFPFQVIGAPWIDPKTLVADFATMEIPGITAVPYAFKPMWSNYAGEFCYGLYFKVSDPSIFLPVKTGLMLMQYLSANYESLQPATYSTLINPTGESHLDRLLGVEHAFNLCLHREPVKNFTNRNSVSNWIACVNSFLDDNP